jgi:hypothetical protein
MKINIIIIAIALSSMISYSSSLENCKCNQYFKSSNGGITFYGETSMGFCDGTISNPTPQIIVYKKECN